MQTPGFFRRNMRWLLPITIIIMAIVVVVILAGLREGPPMKPPADNAPLVELRTLTPGPLQLTVTSQGLVQPKYTTNLVAQVSGEIVSLNDTFVRGGFVKKGDVLATIDPTNYEVALQNAKASLASAQAGLEQEQAQSEVARVEWEDINDRPAPALGLRKPQLAQAQAQLIASEAALKQARKDLERTQIVAPYDALVVARDVSLGTFVNTGTNLGQVVDVSSAEVRLPVGESEYAYLPNGGIGSEVTLRAGEQTWPAQVVRSEGLVDDETRMRYLVAEYRDPYHRESSSDLPPLSFGTFVVAQLQGTQIESAVTIPRTLYSNGRVPLFTEGTLTLREVEVLRHEGGNTVIQSGLQAGDRLVLTPLELAVDGMKLKERDAAPQDGAEDGEPADVEGAD